MLTDRRFSFGFLCALPFVALALAAPRPLHDVPGHAFFGIVPFAIALACMWRLGGSALRREASPDRTLVLAATLLLLPWLLIALLWTGLGAPFQADRLENEHRFIVLMVNALSVGAGFMLLRDALREHGERFYSNALFAAAVPASGLYLACIALTLAQSTMAVQGDHTPFPPVLSHLYDALEFFACSLTYGCTALAATSMRQAGIIGKACLRVFLTLCTVVLVLLVLRGIEYPDITGQAAPWYTQPGVIVRIPAMPWVLPAILAAMMFRAAWRSTPTAAVSR